jgi:predicted SprT family Zn-dependent metalloprotease
MKQNPFISKRSRQKIQVSGVCQVCGDLLNLVERKSAKGKKQYVCSSCYRDLDMEDGAKKQVKKEKEYSDALNNILNV